MRQRGLGVLPRQLEVAEAGLGRIEPGALFSARCELALGVRRSPACRNRQPRCLAGDGRGIAAERLRNEWLDELAEACGADSLASGTVFGARAGDDRQRENDSRFTAPEFYVGHLPRSRL